MTTLSSYLKILPAFLISLTAFGVIFLNSVSADWPTARFDNHNSAAAPFSITELETLWTSQNHGLIIASPVVDRDGNIYLVSYTKGLVALDKNGNQRWTLNFQVNSSPVLDNTGNLYFVGGVCSDIIFSFDKNGQKRWHYAVRPDPSPCDTFHAGPIALSKDQTTLYSGVSYPSKTLLALNTNGTLKWQGSLNSQGVSSIGVADDETIYAGTGGNGYLYALNPNGTIKWSRFTASGYTVHVLSPVLDSAGNIYVVASGSNPPTLVSFDPAGIRRWAIQASPVTGFTTLPALKDQRLYLTEGANLRAVETADGTTLWQWNPGFPPSWYLRPPVVDKDGNIYVSVGDKLFVIDSNGQTKNTITVGNLLREVVIPQDNLILVTKNYSSGGYVIALGKKQPSKTPLILIPGIGGSELKTNQQVDLSIDNGHGGTYVHTYPINEKVWLDPLKAIFAPPEDDYFDILKLKPDGQTVEAPLVLNETMYDGSYGQVIPFFEQNGYKLNQELFVFNYDWRKDLRLTSSSLDAKINSILTLTGASKVDIVAHSMGGLVAREYIRDSQQAQKVNKLIQLGTPHLGSVKFIKAINEGICLKFDIKIGCLSIAPSEVKDVLQNMPGGYTLLPSAIYYQFYDNRDFNHILPVRDDADSDQNSVTGPLTFDQTKSWLVNLGRNANVLNTANTFHDSLDVSFSNGNNVDISLIVGSGLPTIGQVHTYLKTNWLGQQKKEQEEFYINGDQTVPLFSASLTDGSVSLAGTNKIYYVKQEHGALMEIGSEKPALPLVISLLANQPLPGGVATAPFGFSGTAVSIHSPVELHVYDSSNNHTGPTTNGEFETQIPGSFYETSGESKYIFLTIDGQYRFEIKGVGNGTFDLKLQNYNNNDLTSSTLYRNVPVTPNTIAQANYDTSNNTAPSLQIDTNGDGSFEQSVNATSQLSGTQAFDTTSPVTTTIVQGTAGQNNWYRSDVVVTLSAQDNTDGSGILTTEYSLDNGSTVQTYTGPITINQSTAIQFRSIDKAGNEENIQNIAVKIDKISPEADISFDPQLEEFKVAGNDGDSGIAQTNSNDYTFTVTDLAGNTLVINLQDKDSKRSEKISIKSLVYNEITIPAVDNSFKVSYALDKKTKEFKELEQEIKIEGVGKLKARWNENKDRTTVIEKEIGEKKEKQILNGLKLLQLKTNQGILSFGY